MYDEVKNYDELADEWLHAAMQNQVIDEHRITQALVSIALTQLAISEKLDKIVGKM